MITMKISDDLYAGPKSVPMKNEARRPGHLGMARASSPRPALELVDAERRVTYALSDLAKARRLRDEGVLAPDEYEHRVLAHAAAERELNDLLRWLNATQ